MFAVFSFTPRAFPTRYQKGGGVERNNYFLGVTRIRTDRLHSGRIFLSALHPQSRPTHATIQVASSFITPDRIPCPGSRLLPIQRASALDTADRPIFFPHIPFIDVLCTRAPPAFPLQHTFGHAASGRLGRAPNTWRV